MLHIFYVIILNELKQKNEDAKEWDEQNICEMMNSLTWLVGQIKHTIQTHTKNRRNKNIPKTNIKTDMRMSRSLALKDEWITEQKVNQIYEENTQRMNVYWFDS